MLLGGLVSSFGVSALSAQVSFTQPVRRVDVSRYTTVEECSALLNRVTDSVQRNDPMSAEIDTFPVGAANAAKRTPFPALITNTAKACMAQFQAEQIRYEDFALFVPLLLSADRDAEVEQVTARFLQQTSSARDSGRAMLEITLHAYLNARPARYAAALRLLGNQLERPSRPAKERLSLLARSAEIALLMGDTVHAEAFVDRAMVEHTRLTEEQGATIAAGTPLPAQILLGRLTRQEMLDSLRRGIQPYVRLRQSDRRFVKRLPESRPQTIHNIGDRAAPLTGEFWFTTDTAPESQPLVRPTAGKATLITFLSQACRRMQEEPEPQREEGERDDRGCFEQYAILKRLKHRFPDIELIIATNTNGYYWPVGVTEPANEARYLQQWWLGYHRIPATLVVTTTSFWRLAAPDRRRIDEAGPNDSVYNTTLLSSVLVGPDGTVLDWFDRLSREDEPWIGELMTVLTSRVQP